MKKTYGQAIIDHHQKQHELDDDPIEYRKQLEKEILANINTTIEKARKSSLYASKPFYIVLLFKIEKIGQAERSFVFARRSCPTPIYKQSVWKFDPISDTLEYLWSIPDQILYYHIVRNAQKYLADKECADLAKFVMLMESGELLSWCKHENGEDKVDAVIKINKEIEC